MFTKYKPHAGCRKAGKFHFCHWWPWLLTLTFKLVWARDQTRFPCEFGANPFSGSRDISYTNKKTDWRRQKQNLPQFTACGNKSSVKCLELPKWHSHCKDRWMIKLNNNLGDSSNLLEIFPRHLWVVSSDDCTQRISVEPPAKIMSDAFH